LSAELTAALRLLREHAFLRYVPSGAAEYEEKVRTACGMFASAVSRAAGAPVPNPYPAATIDGLGATGPDAGVRAARRVAAALAKASAANPGSDRLRRAADAWRRASEALYAASWA